MPPKRRTHNNNAQQQQPQFAVEIRNWNRVSPQELVSFILRKLTVGLQNTQVDPQGVFTGYCMSQRDADTVAKWLGVVLAGQKLSISVRAAPGTLDTIGMLKLFLQKRYNPQNKALDLLAMLQDPDLVRNGLSSTLQQKMLMAMMKVAEQIKLQVETVNLSLNQLRDLSSLLLIPATFSNLRNLLLANNELRKRTTFENWRRKLPRLHELVLSGNPWDNPVETAKEVVGIFPMLCVLDGAYVRDANKLAQFTRFPFATAATFFENGDISNAASLFVANFLQCWDLQETRDQLLPLYAPQLQFLYSCDTLLPHDELAASVNNSELQWGYYTLGSRNLHRVLNDRLRANKLHTGAEAIAKAFASLPSTRHPLHQSPHLFSIEGWNCPQLNGFYVLLHGEFEEVAPPKNLPPPPSHRGGRGGRGLHSQRLQKTVLSPKLFDRVFVVVPNNGGLIVATDTLLVRWHCHPAWVARLDPTSAPTLVLASPAPAGASRPEIPANIAAGLTPVQIELLQRIMVETRLNLNYAGLLCQQSNWDYASAKANFENSRASLPPDAYA